MVEFTGGDENKSFTPDKITSKLFLSSIRNVTILILIDGFLQFHRSVCFFHGKWSHNPYFNRWFSAIKICSPRTKSNIRVTILILIDGFLQ